MEAQIHEVIIIGCGISGIGASQTLSMHGIEHIVLQSRDRIGGRIFSQQLDGVSVDMGAMVVHHPHENNPIKKYMDQIGWKYFNKRYDSKQIMIASDTEISEAIKQRSYIVYQSILSKLQKYAQKSKQDISFLQAMKPFLQHQTASQSPEVIRFVQVLLKIHGNIQGAELSQISAQDLFQDDPSDVIPSEGYAKLIETIYSNHKNIIFFNERVKSIDFTTDIIEVRTIDRTYYAKRVISSLPLGILKSKQVKFTPQLSNERLRSIENIGISIFNKIQVSFETPFWDTTKQYILLASNTDQKYYRMRSIIENSRYILCVYVSGEASEELSKLSNEQILNDFIECLKRHYTKGEIKVRDYLITRWHKDENCMGSYSYYHVGKTTVEDVFELKKPIDGKVWFIGEHCAPEMTGTAHAAFRSGVQAANEVAISFSNMI